MPYMPIRIRPLDEASRRSRREVMELGNELGNARRTSGISQAVLERCGYVQTPDPVTISVGVPPALVPRMQGHVCSLDFV